MPRLLSYHGIIFYIYFMDLDFHSLPHFHVKYGEFDASIGLDGTLLAGSIPAKQLKIIQKIAKMYEPEFEFSWEQAVNGEHFSQIEIDYGRLE